MNSAELLVDALGWIRGSYTRSSTTSGPINWPPSGPQANSIAWSVWHPTRIQDDYLADGAQTEQV
jgi:hypothetical protein